MQLLNEESCICIHCFRDPTSFDQGLQVKVFHYSLLLAETVFLHSHVMINNIFLTFLKDKQMRL